MAAWIAKNDGLTNFSMLVSYVLMPQAIRVLMTSPHNPLQGFIAPRDLCTVMGFSEYEDLASQFAVPIVVGGSEPPDFDWLGADLLALWDATKTAHGFDVDAKEDRLD